MACHIVIMTGAGISNTRRSPRSSPATALTHPAMSSSLTVIDTASLTVISELSFPHDPTPATLAEGREVIVSRGQLVEIDERRSQFFEKFRDIGLAAGNAAGETDARYSLNDGSLP